MLSDDKTPINIWEAGKGPHLRVEVKTTEGYLVTYHVTSIRDARRVAEGYEDLATDAKVYRGGGSTVIARHRRHLVTGRWYKAAP